MRPIIPFALTALIDLADIAENGIYLTGGGALLQIIGAIFGIFK